jgi:hypothetical protein
MTPRATACGRNCHVLASAPVDFPAGALRRPRVRSTHVGLDDEVVLEGGRRDGQPVPFDAMRRIAVGEYVLDDPLGVYRHSVEDAVCFRDGQRMAIFEPAVPADDPPGDRSR